MFPHVLFRADHPVLLRVEERKVALPGMLLRLDFVPSVGQVKQGTLAMPL